jgi:hypothetical protein
MATDAQALYTALEKGEQLAIEKNNTRTLAPGHIELLNQDIREEVATLKKLLASVNVLLCGISVRQINSFQLSDWRNEESWKRGSPLF